MARSKKRRKKRQATAIKVVRAAQPTPPRTRRLLGVAVGAAGWVFAEIAAIASIDAVWGPIWPTDPVIHPKDTVNASMMILPFTVQNRSVVFPIKDAEFTCGVGQAYIVDSKGDVLSVPDLAVANDTHSISPGATINYACDALRIAKISSQGEEPIIYKMCIWVAMDYQVFDWLPWRRHFASVMFQWPAIQGQNQWQEGPTLHEGDPQAYSVGNYGSPLTIVDCSPRPPEIYKRFNGRKLEIIKDGRVIRTL